MIVTALVLRPLVHSALRLNFKNQAKLQAYQREYAQRKRAPGPLKSQQSGAAAAGGTVCKKTVNNESSGPAENPGHCPFPVHSFPSMLQNALVEDGPGALSLRSETVTVYVSLSFVWTWTYAYVLLWTDGLPP